MVTLPPCVYGQAMSMEVALTVGAVAFAILLVLWRRGGRAKGGPALPPPSVEDETATSADASGLRRRPNPANIIRPLHEDDSDSFYEDSASDDELTILRVALTNGTATAMAETELIFADSEAELDVPTGVDVALVTAAIAQTDVGRRRKRNDDRYLKMDSHYVYAVADGMGGHAGGHIAAEIAVEAVRDAFANQSFGADVNRKDLPWRAAELAKAVQQANLAIHERARREPWLKDMGTTMVAARFAPRKERLYLAHVGDSRCYRLRDGRLKQLTKDHTLGELGIVDDGPSAGALSRAVGVSPRLTIDLIVAKPRIDDLYLLCTDGLSRMLDDVRIVRTLTERELLQDAAEALIELANDEGGKDNVTVLLVRVCAPAQVEKTRDLAKRRVS